jgi:hypothetical protein
VDIREVVKDSLSYPLTNWKSFLILGVILTIANLLMLVFTNSFAESLSLRPDYRLLSIVWIAYFVADILFLGYLIKIFKSTVDSENVLPEFNGWLNIIVDGFKGIIIVIVYYIIPFYILFALVLILTRGFNSNDILELFDLINTLYTIVIIPVIALALANMAFDERLLSAFSFGEILDDMREIGWSNLLALYLLFGIIYLIIGYLPLGYLLGWISPFLVTIIKSMIIIPYLYIFATRAVSLIYRSSVVDT